MTGRFASIIVDIALEPDERPYDRVYDYCGQMWGLRQKIPGCFLMRKQLMLESIKKQTKSDFYSAAGALDSV